MDYEKIRQAAKTGEKLIELAISLGLDPKRHTIKEMADILLQRAMADTPPAASKH